MLANTLSITYAAASVTLTRVSEQSFSSTYFGESASGEEKFTLTVKHTIPDRGQSGESHLVRLDCEHYDSVGTYVRTSSVWSVMKTFDGSQASSEIIDLGDALDTLVDSTFRASLAARES